MFMQPKRNVTDEIKITRAVSVLVASTQNKITVFSKIKPHIFHRDISMKRSLGQSNVFTPVCDSFCSQGVPPSAGGMPSIQGGVILGGAVLRSVWPSVMAF